MKVKVVRYPNGSVRVSLCGFNEDTREQILSNLPPKSELVEVISAETREQQEALDVFGALAEFQREQPNSLGAALDALINKIYHVGFDTGVSTENDRIVSRSQWERGGRD